jgi:hypothetical protein
MGQLNHPPSWGWCCKPHGYQENLLGIGTGAGATASSAKSPQLLSCGTSARMSLIYAMQHTRHALNAHMAEQHVLPQATKCCRCAPHLLVCSWPQACHKHGQLLGRGSPQRATPAAYSSTAGETADESTAALTITCDGSRILYVQAMHAVLQVALPWSVLGATQCSFSQAMCCRRTSSLHQRSLQASLAARPAAVLPSLAPHLGVGPSRLPLLRLRLRL